MNLEAGRVAVVSGGSRGIGAATARRLAVDGWDIAFSYQGDGPSAREVEKAVFEVGARAIGTDVDVTDAAEVTSWFRLTEDELGPVQAAVSCAGITREQPLVCLAEADWRTVIDTSLAGVFHVCRAAVFAMMERRSGRIVTVTSVCGEYDHDPHGHDTLARPGVAGFTRALASGARKSVLIRLTRLVWSTCQAALELGDGALIPAGRAEILALALHTLRAPQLS